MPEPDSASSAEESTEPVVGPRLFSPRGALIALGILIFAVLMSAASIYMRRTPMEKTTEFFGRQVIVAIQLGEQLRITIPPESPMVDANAPLAMIAEDGSQVADLSGSPGLGHFRHALLNERHYDWDSVVEKEVGKLGIDSPEYVIVDIEGRSPEAKPVPMPIEIDPAKLQIELTEGWVGVVGVPKSVRMTERVRTGMRNFIETRKDIGSHPSR